jgi:hypothetical protein
MCEHNVLIICEEVEEHGPVCEYRGEPVFDCTVVQFYRCANPYCRARVEGLPPLDEDYSPYDE